MSEFLGLTPAEPVALTNPLPVAPYTNAERFDLAYEASQATGRSYAPERNYRLAFDRAAEAFRAQGVELPNPYTDLASAYDQTALERWTPGAPARRARLAEAERERRLALWEEAAARLQAENPDALDTYQGPAQIRAAADVRAAQAFRANQAADGMGGGWGSFAGDIVGAMQDPVQLLTLPFGSAWRGVTGGLSLGREVLRVASIEAGVAAATQAAIEASAAPYRERLGVEGGAMESIAAAAAGGAVLGGGLRAVLGALQLRGPGPMGEAARPVDVAAADLATLARAQVDELAGNPAGPERAPQHQAAMDQAVAEVASGRTASVTVEPPLPDVPPGAARGYVERMLAGVETRPTDSKPARFHVFTPPGRAVVVEPQVVELDQLIPSHLEDGTSNPAYPHAEGVQPRDRGAAPSRDQVRAIAAGLIPERLAPNVEAGLGAPIVADDLVVESGNGRVLALREVFSNPDLAPVAEAYRAFLASQGHDVAGMQAPVLISRRISALTPEERRAFVQEANGRTTLAQNVAERARGDATKLDQALPFWRGGDVSSVANADFVLRFLQEFTPEERGAMQATKGTLSAEGATRLRAALLARAYGDEMGPLLERFLDGDTEGLAGIAGALTDAAARWATLRQAVANGDVDAGMDRTADLIGAVRTLTEARRLGITARELLLQGDLERAPLTDMSRAILATMFSEPGLAGRLVRRDVLAARLDGFVDEALKVRPGLDLFGAPPVRAEDVFGGVRMQAAPAAAEAGGDAPVFRFDAPPAAPRAAPEAPSPDPYAARQAALLAEAERVQALRPKLDQAATAELLEAQRIAAAGDVPVPALVGDGTAQAVPPIGARALLDEAEAEMDAAAQTGACMLGSLL